jgi:hypothetical protein
LLLYQAFGSGIQRALDAWPEIDFTDDQDGCLFTATVHRNVKTSLKFFIKEWSCQTYHRFLTRMIFPPFDWLSQELSVIKQNSFRPEYKLFENEMVTVLSLKNGNIKMPAQKTGHHARKLSGQGRWKASACLSGDT